MSVVEYTTKWESGEWTYCTDPRLKRLPDEDYNVWMDRNGYNLEQSFGAGEPIGFEVWLDKSKPYHWIIAVKKSTGSDDIVVTSFVDYMELLSSLAPIATASLMSKEFVDNVKTVVGVSSEQARASQKFVEHMKDNLGQIMKAAEQKLTTPCQCKFCKEKAAEVN